MLRPVVLLLGLATAAAAQNAPDMRAVQFLVGTWSCAHTVGDFKGTYTTTYTSALDGQWLRQIYDFPTLGSGTGPAHGEFFIGYDSHFKRWVRWGMLSTGDYWAMTATQSDNTWSWSYALPRRPGSGTYEDKDQVTWMKKSDAEYIVDCPTYPQNGKTVTEHHDCRKS
jgi:hypothetical protein